MKILFSLIAAIIITGCSSTLSDNDFVKEKGEEILIDSGNYASLISRYEASLKESESDTLRFKLANAYYLSGDGEAAMFQLSQIDPDSIDSAEFSLLRANIYYDRGAYQKSLQYVNMAIRSESKLGEAYNLQGLIAAQQGELDKAKSAFENARVHHYNDAYVKNNLSMVAMLQGNYYEAISILTPLVQSGRADDTAKANLLLAYAKTGKTRAFSNMLSDSESDIHLADKYRSLNAAQPHLDQSNNLQKRDERSTLFDDKATFIEDHSKFIEPKIHNINVEGEHPDREDGNEGISSIEKTKQIASQSAKKDLSTQKSTTKKTNKEILTSEHEIDVNAQSEKIGVTSQTDSLKKEPAFSEEETIKNNDHSTSKLDGLALAKLRDHLKKAKNKKLESKSKSNVLKPSSKMLVTNLVQKKTKDGFVYIATSDFPFGEIDTLHLKNRRKWVFDIQGAKNFTTKRKRYYKYGPARAVELGEHDNFVRIVITVRKGEERKPELKIKGNKLLIQWRA
ncbi:hypothetical protein BCT30_03410 [Enterovibrio norvegicus]|uniref:tetratricopeptide repeat protein n=1 Tax=Enterovibrio norvegicus TaxID=188144 RepID=UPI000C85E9E8|nr:tetratricopeptide repeat protein [Enterovibrio norvegicus]MCC4797728.1 hypothetical protein [Enterovibrio norvegicus]PMI32744.1 hypothetical protein BCU47_11650 [Enterovibrio norvegicus]PMI38816.1 hypothetical protein BCU46_07435 [Enterovibrio norvegicus]PMN45565.1 hypothetical protein BCT30_03410 [Enterovibrio norvegicus]TKF19069.1 hypothetical protein FCV66_02570 [Enterovibrio norvegicus]